MPPDVLSNLVPALSQTFSIILIGFASYEAFGKRGQRALEVLVTRYALPCTVMVGIAGIDFTLVNWTFVLAVFVAKSVTFAVTVALTVMTADGEAGGGGGGGRSASYERRMVRKKAAIRGMFTTLSNDFALGVPIFNALFPAEYASYIFLVAPVTLVLLNPIAFVIMEMNKIEPGEERGGGGGDDDDDDEEEGGERGRECVRVKVVVDNQTDADCTVLMIQTETSAPPPPPPSPPSSGRMPRSASLPSLTSPHNSSSWGRIVQKTVRVLDSMSVNVVNATIHNDADGHALDVLHVQRDDGGKVAVAEEELREVLEAVISGRAPLRAVVAGRWKQPRPARAGAGGHRRSSSTGELSEAVLDLSTPYPDLVAPPGSDDGAGSVDSGDSDGSRGSFARIFVNVLITPVVSMALLGVLVNLAETHGNIALIPKVVLMPIQNMAAAYSALALFALGLSLASLKALAPPDGAGVGGAGGEKAARRGRQLLPFSVSEVRLVSFLVAMKSLLVPYLCMQVCYVFSGDSDIGVAAFLYGMLPTAPSVSLFASLYRVANDVKIIPAATLVGTCVMPPLVYLGARLMMVAVSAATDMAFYLSIIDESIGVLGVIESVAALWTLLAFTFTSIFSRSQMKRRLLGHAAFWMLACGVADVVSARLDRRYMHAELPSSLSRPGLALNMLRYGAAVVSRMLVSASVVAAVLSYGEPGASCLSYFSRGGARRGRRSAYRRLRRQPAVGDADADAESAATAPLLAGDRDGDGDGEGGDDDVRLSYVGYAEPPSVCGGWIRAVALELGLHLGCLGVGALAILITFLGGATDISKRGAATYGLCWPWLVLNPAQVITAAVLVLVNVVVAVHGLYMIEARERSRAGAARRRRAGGARGASDADADNVVVIDRPGGADADPADLAKGAGAGGAGAYEYQWEAELDFLPTLTRTERFVAFLNFEVFVLVVNLFVTLTTSLLMLASSPPASRSPGADGAAAMDKRFSRLESSLLYFDAIVSALRACWLFALYGYRPGVLYFASLVKKALARRAAAAAGARAAGGEAAAAAAARAPSAAFGRRASMASASGGRRERSYSFKIGLKAALESWGGRGKKRREDEEKDA